MQHQQGRQFNNSLVSRAKRAGAPAKRAKACGAARVGQFRPRNGGFAALFAVLIMLSSLTVSVAVMGLATLNGQKIAANLAQSSQAYYSAQAGVEDSLYRVIKGKKYAAANSLNIASGITNVNISDINGKKIITANGEHQNKIRNLQATVIVSTDAVSFHYGVQVGEGGLEMENNSQVTGSIYSNGPISGANGAVITGDAWAGGAAGTLNSVTVNGNAHANTITNSTIGGDAYYQTITNTTVGGIQYPASADPPMESMPISENTINDWQNDAALGGVINGNYTINGSTASLGPKKIIGDLTVTNGADLTVTGTLYITGNISISNNAKIRLSANYGETSGVLISDGIVNVGNNVTFYTNAAGSYLLVLATKTGEAINISNNTNTVIFYASRGTVDVSNNAVLKEVTAYKIELSNNAQVLYETGLASAKFSSGPGATWAIEDWKEVP